MALKQPTILAESPDADRRRRFTIDEANRTLPYVGRVARDVVETYRRIVDLRRELEEDGSRDLAESELDYEKQMDRLSDLVDELHLVGVELRDFEKGTVDFPAWHRGHEVMLTWSHGDELISFWHEHEDAFDEQRPISDLAA